MKKYLCRIVYLAICTAAVLLGTVHTVQAAQPYEAIASQYEWEVLKLLNHERLSAGMEPLSICESMQKAADVRVKEITSFFSHNRPDGRSCFSVLGDKKISYRTAAENIAAGYKTPENVMEGWMNSPGHKANILNDAFDHAGIGYGTGGTYGANWVQLFVGGCSVTKITVNDSSEVYPVGTGINAMNRYLKVTCSVHGTSYVPVIGDMCTGYHAGKSGQHNVMVSYHGKTVSMTVKTGADDVQTENGAQKNVKKPGRVTGLKAVKVTRRGIKLKWGKKKCDGYEVWRAETKTGTYKKVKTIAKQNRNSCNNLNLEPGKLYYFKVRAYNKDGKNKKYGSFSKAKGIVTYGSIPK